MKKIVIVDYGMGNLKSVYQALNFVNNYNEKNKIIISKNPQDILNANKIILPGQGAMPDCLNELKKQNLINPLLETITINKKPLFGICVGMQILLSFSEEGNINCLNLIEGKVKKFDFKNLNKEENNENNKFKIPHIGWNKVYLNQDNKKQKKHFMINNLKDKSYFYFVHSYYVECKSKEYIFAETNHGNNFNSIIIKDNLFATQFHPEKSSETGLFLFKNFLEWEYK